MQNDSDNKMEQMNFKFPIQFCNSLRILSSILNKDMTMIIMESVLNYTDKTLKERSDVLSC